MNRHVSSRTGRYGLACTFLLLVLALAFPHCVEAEGGGAREKIQKVYADLREFEGTFRQRSVIKELDQEQEAEGHFLIVRPDRVRWDYVKPSRQSTIIRGQEMFLWQEGSSEVWPSRYDEKAYGKTPLAVLSGLGRMDEDFEVTIVSADMLRLVPREKDGFIREITLNLGNGAFPVQMMKVTDLYENENTFEFVNVRINEGFAPESFEPASLLQAAAGSRP